MKELVASIGRAIFVGALLSLPFAASCSKSNGASTSASARSDEEIVRERATRWWECRLQRDYKSQYDLWDPAYKSKVNLDSFMAGMGSNIYYKYEIKNVAVTGDTALVTVEYVSKIGLRVPNLEPEPQTTETDQEWVKVDGAWYFKCPDNPFQAARDAASRRRKSPEKPAEKPAEKPVEKPAAEPAEKK